MHKFVHLVPYVSVQLYDLREVFQLPIHCETIQVPFSSAKDMPSIVPTQQSFAVLTSTATESPGQLGWL